MRMQAKKQSKILDECLRNIWAGRATVDECLRRFPDDAPRLALMLTLAVEAKDRLAPGKPKPSFVGASRRRVLLDVAHRLYNSSLIQATPKPARSWKPAYAFISLMLVIGVLATSAGVVQAASAALPGDPLYGLKRGLERVRLAITWSDPDDMRLLVQFADVRLAEIEALLAAGRHEDLEAALEGYEEALSDLMALAAAANFSLDPDLSEYVLERLAYHQEVLTSMHEMVSAVAQTAIDDTIEHLSLCLAALGPPSSVVFVSDPVPIPPPFLDDDPGQDWSDEKGPIQIDDDDQDDLDDDDQGEDNDDQGEDDQGDDQGDDDQGDDQGGDDQGDDQGGDDQGDDQGGDDQGDDQGGDDQGGDDQGGDDQGGQGDDDED